MQDAPLQSPLPQQSQVPSHGLAQEQVNTVSVICHPDSLEVVIQADMFAVGAPVHSSELRLGVEYNKLCMAKASGDVYRILVRLEDCGTRHWMTKDALVYTNLLIYSPMASPDGIIRMDEAVIPLECHYQRKYSLSSSSLVPTWIPFTSTQATVETLQFNLRIMTDDWNYERAANVFYLGEPIKMEASVRLGHHTGLRVFLSSCVATLEPDIHSDPKYIFIENGCLVDSQLPDSKAHFLIRTQDEKLQLVFDAFKFHNDDRGELYITCHLNAAPVTDTESPNKACTFINGRWRSADGNDYLCGYCKSQNDPVSKGLPGSFGPRGFGIPAEFEPMWRSSLKSSQVWDHEARIGPVTVLSSRKSGPLPAEQLPPALLKIYRPALYGSHWRSGINQIDLEKGLLPGPSTPELDEEDDNETTPKGDEELDELVSNFKMKAFESAMDKNTTAFSDITTSEFDLDIPPTNATATESDLSEMIDPKK
ncbi:zona pellucida sperm-binding protein 3-like [Melanotaenia boesemani]|uniref:zona pellucida sperm-binding protein 3-like n=1 Tax=Melanotaenia boesemani TaxID=1250792 RepID=UPI001C04BC5D|nr:zona pellucida sperm-binding protein 3-like [Melanotaenia boesemani]